MADKGIAPALLIAHAEVKVVPDHAVGTMLAQENPQAMLTLPLASFFGEAAQAEERSTDPMPRSIDLR